jgi:hypothetical protein
VFFQKDLMKNNLNDSRQSDYKNPNKIIVNTSNINDSIADSQNNSLRMDHQNRAYLNNKENYNPRRQKHNNNYLYLSQNQNSMQNSSQNIYPQQNTQQNNQYNSYNSHNPNEKNPGYVISPTKLTEKEVMTYHSSNDEDELYVAQPSERVRSLHIEDMKKSNISYEDDNNDLKYFNTAADDLNNRIKKLMNGK